MPTSTGGQFALAFAMASVALVTSIASIALNAIFAVSLSHLPAIQSLAYASVGLNALCAVSLIFFVVCYTRKITAKSMEWTGRFTWTIFSIGVLISSIAIAIAAATLVWITLRRRDVRSKVAGQSANTMLVAWWAVWGVDLAAQISSYTILGLCTRRSLRGNSIDQDSLEFGLPPPSIEERPTTKDTTRSFQSQDPTLAATPPQTPKAGSNRNSIRSSSSGRLRPGSSRAKMSRASSLARDSAKSSFDTPTEAGSIEDGFDGWDTSAVGRDMRRTLQSSPSAPVLALETIPGSRPESPAKPLDGPFLPDTPHASTTDVNTAREESSSYFPSSPISAVAGPSATSTPNFSRPTSRQYNAGWSVPSLNALPPPTPPMEELIHPLFRESSPTPPPQASPGTSVHAAPIAGQTMSQKTLVRMRSGSLTRQGSPLIEHEVADDPGLGNPGPAIIEEEENGPILPSFILSAGQRSSLLGYGKRKSSVRGRSSSSSDLHTSTL